jgi:hypothetical protein
MWTPANVSSAYANAKAIDIQSPENSVCSSVRCSWGWKTHVFLFLLAAIIPGDSFFGLYVLSCAAILRILYLFLRVLLGRFGFLPDWNHQAQLRAIIGLRSGSEVFRRVRVRTIPNGPKESWVLDNEVCSDRDLRVTNQRHVKMAMPSSLFSYEVVEEYYTIATYYGSEFLDAWFGYLPLNFGDSTVEFISEENKSLSSVQILKASAALLAELSDSDLFGVNIDQEVAHDRIKSKLRSVKNVNLDRFGELSDQIYLGTEYLARCLWKDRTRTIADLPSF